MRKIRYISAVACLSLAVACHQPSEKENSDNELTANGGKKEFLMLVGSYAEPTEEGIKLYRFNEENGQATYVSGLSGISNPSFLVTSSDEKRIYAVSEEEDETSTAHAIRLEKEKMSWMNSRLTQGGAPCNITIDPSGEFVLTANYMGGSITVFPLDKEGALGEASHVIRFTGNGPDSSRQEQPHLHSVLFTPDHSYLLANDLGTDRLYLFPINQVTERGNGASLLNESKRVDIPLEPGSGPRHICFHPDKPFAYLINELSGKVTAFSYAEGQMAITQYIEADTVGARGSADIHVSPDGRFLYASNRLKADGVAIFSIDSLNGSLTKVGYQLTGRHPRNFAISPNGKYLLVASRDDNVIQIFRRDASTGLLKDTGKEIRTSRPVCLKFLRF